MKHLERKYQTHPGGFVDWRLLMSIGVSLLVFAVVACIDDSQGHELHGENLASTESYIYGIGVIAGRRANCIKQGTRVLSPPLYLDPLGTALAKAEPHLVEEHPYLFSTLYRVGFASATLDTTDCFEIVDDYLFSLKLIEGTLLP